MTEFVAGCLFLAAWAAHGARVVGRGLRRLLGGRVLMVLVVAYLAVSVSLAVAGFPGGAVVPVALGAGYVLLVLGEWVEVRVWRRRLRAAQLEAEWRAVTADDADAWVKDGPPERLPARVRLLSGIHGLYASLGPKRSFACTGFSPGTQAGMPAARV